MKQRTFDEQNLVKLLANAAGASYTQVWTQLLDDHERLIYKIIGHDSVDVLFNVQVASSAAGANAESIFTNVAVNAVGVHTLEISSAVLNRLGKFYVSPLVTWTAGTYSLEEIRTALRNEGNLTSRYDATWLSHQAQLT